jgi:pilus assembly protein Flp/PilA
MLGTIWARLGQVYVTALTRNPLEREEGQALVEYALILALIAVAAVTALTLLGGAISSKLTFIKDSI